MLVVSNNVCESFFKVLKHILLKGRPCKSLLGFLQMWDTYQSQLVVNCLKANINVHQLLGHVPREVKTVHLPAAVRALVPAAFTYEVRVCVYMCLCLSVSVCVSLSLSVSVCVCV
jgi:hypothetical protein